MKFRIGLVAFIILVAVIGVAAFLFLPKGSAKNGIYFNTYEGVYAKITGSVSGNANSITLSDLTYGEGATPTADELASWQVNLEFGEEDEITITINVENKNTNSLYVIFKDDKQTINNVTKTILNDGRPYTSGKVVLLQSDTDTTLFTITFRRDQDVITSIRYNYHIELKAEVTDADIQDGSIEAEESSGYTYTFNTNGTAVITGLSTNNTQANLDLPNVVAHENQLYLITAIGSNAFKNKTTITSVTIPNTVTELGNGVFEGCTSLTNVTIPTSVTKLGSKVFKGCSNLITIELPNSITNIGTHLFSGCTKLTNYNIPSQITKLTTRMFENCTRITEFTFPTQITTLGDYVFNGLSFETLTIPDTITTLTENSFSGITNIGELTLSCYITSLESANNGLFTGVTNIDKAIITTNNNGTEIGKAFRGAVKLQEVEISDGVTVIGSYAFSGCNALLEVDFKENSQLTEIESYAFSCCSALANIVFPSSLQEIGVRAFCECYGIESVDFEENSQLTSMGEMAFSDCGALKRITLPFVGESKTPVVLDGFPLGWIFGTTSFNNSTKISQRYLKTNGTEATKYYYIPSGLTEVKILEENVKYGSFYNCSMIQTVIIGSGVQTINQYAFYYCSNLSEVIFEENSELTSIGRLAFCRSSLINITIPASVTEIDSSAFNSCENIFIVNNLSNLDITISTTGIGSYARIVINDANFGSEKLVTDNGVKYYKESATRYWAYDVVDKEQTEVTLSSKTTVIARNTFKACAISYITIPEGVTNILNNAFNGCNGLYIINNLSQIDLSIGGEMYTQSGADARLVINDVNFSSANFGVVDGIKYYCENSSKNWAYDIVDKTLTEISINPTTTGIAKDTFKACTALRGLYIPNSVVDVLGPNATKSPFNNSSLDIMIYVQHASKPDGWGEYWNYYNENSSLVVEWGKTTEQFNQMCTAISNYMAEHPEFTYNSSGDIIGYVGTSEDVVIPFGVTKIGQEAFKDNTTIRTLTCSDTLRVIGKKAFNNCGNLQSVSFSKSVKSVGFNAFYDCNALTSVSTTSLLDWMDISFIYFPGNADSDSPYANPLYYAHHLYINGVELAGRITIPASAKVIKDSTFVGCEGITYVTIESGITEIGLRSFTRCTNLAGIYIPDSVQRIGFKAFEGCSSLNQEGVSIESINGWITKSFITYHGAGGALRSYASNPLLNAHKLLLNNELITSITIPKETKNLYTTFCGLSTLTTVLFENGSELENISLGAFEGCTALVNIILPDGVIGIGEKAFRSCTNLRTIYIPNSVQSISSLKVYELPFIDCSNELVIYTNLSEKPEGWDSYWNIYNNNNYNTLTVVWGTSLEEYQTIVNS